MKQAKRLETSRLVLQNEEMFQQNPEGEGDIYNPVVSLPDMTQKKQLIPYQRTKKWLLFLMVEEEGIDEMAHNDNASLTIKAGQQLDKAVEVAKAYAKIILILLFLLLLTMKLVVLRLKIQVTKMNLVMAFPKKMVLSILLILINNLW
ncbi:hypothetical protein GCM10020331_005430 [Ectobacillus funiculus]